MGWSSRKKKYKTSFVLFILSAKMFFKIFKDTLSEYTYFYILKTLLYTFSLLVFEIFESFQCILKQHLTKKYVNICSKTSTKILLNNLRKKRT